MNMPELFRKRGCFSPGLEVLKGILGKHLDLCLNISMDFSYCEAPRGQGVLRECKWLIHEYNLLSLL